MTYRVITAYDIGPFEDSINDLLRHGWELVGGVSVTMCHGGLRYAQAMVKR